MVSREGGEVEGELGAGEGWDVGPAGGDLIG